MSQMDMNMHIGFPSQQTGTVIELATSAALERDLTEILKVNIPLLLKFHTRIHTIYLGC
jgi:hypothetical protein